MLRHDERLKKEAEWYRQGHARHPLNRWPFYSDIRHQMAYDMARWNLVFRVRKLIPRCQAMLLAPCGTGTDAAPFLEVWPSARVTGIDISPEAVERSQLRGAQVGDILHMPFPDSSFDVAICTLFFHHVFDEGCEPYLRELHRVLKPGGSLVTMEPSSWHPLLAVTRPLRRLLGNITNQVEHEHPIRVSRLLAAMQHSGFTNTTCFACSFGHNRMPTAVACALNVLRFIPQLTPLAWIVGIVARKD
jgi:SAM-dependent methyltransferase